MADILSQLEAEPALAWKTAVCLRGADPDSIAAQQAAQTVSWSPLVKALLQGRDETGHPYRKWTGSHWTLSLLADLGCAPGDESIRPLMEETFDCWLGEGHKKHVRQIAGRTRRCASQEGNAVWSSLKLDLVESSTHILVEHLLEWQWPDGGWNCDKRPEAMNSSFMETLIPLRALSLYAQMTDDPKARIAAERAAEVFLKRRLFKRQADGSVMDPHFVLLHYPAYWHYDILFGLKVMAEAGFLADPRCADALDLLESKRLPDGGFPAEETYARPTRPESSGYSPVTWGGRSAKKANLFVTADALFVLRAAGRIKL